MKVLLVNSGERRNLTVRKAIVGYVPWLTSFLRQISPLLPGAVTRKALGGFGTSEKRFPLGLGYLAGELNNHGHTVDLVDRFCSPESWNDTADGYDFIGIYSSTPCFQDTLRIISLLENSSFKGKIAVGGPHTTAFPDTIPPRVDYVVQGEGEYVINDLVEGAYPSGCSLRTQRIVDLDLLARPDYDLFIRCAMPYQTTFGYSDAKPVFNMNTSRSCPLTCKFCSVKDIWGRMWRGQSAERVLVDVEYLRRRYNIGGIYFREDYFLANKNRAVAICEGLIKRRITMDWACETRVDTASDEEFVKLLARSGCKGFYIGAESGSQRMLDIYNKRTTVEQIVRTCANAKKYGISVSMALIVANPEETTEDRLATFSLIRQTKPDVILASPYRNESMRHGSTGFTAYAPRTVIDVSFANGTWGGQHDRLLQHTTDAPPATNGSNGPDCAARLPHSSQPDTKPPIGAMQW